MATKQTSLRAKKQEKRQKRSKTKQAIARKDEARGKFLIGRREMAKLMDDSLPGTFNEADIGKLARQRLRKMKKRVREGGMTKEALDEEIASDSQITNKTTMESINDVIPIVIRIHSGIELFTRLGEEKRFEITPEQQTLINTADEQVTHLTEDINAITVLIEAGKEPDDYMEVLMHYTELLARFFEVTMPALMLMLTPQKPLIDAYANEHRNKELPMFEFMRGLHIERMEKVFMTYRTPMPGVDPMQQQEPEHAYTPDNPMPMDPVIDEDVAEADIIAEIPDLEKELSGTDNA